MRSKGDSTAEPGGSDTAAKPDRLLSEQEKRLAQAARRLEAIRRERAEQARHRRQVVGALALVAIAAALLAVELLLPHHDLPVLSLKDFRDLPAVTSVTARPPSLYVTVDPDIWKRLDQTGRTRLVQEIGLRAQRVRYTGALLRTPDNRTLGQWFANGTVIVQPDPTGASS